MKVQERILAVLNSPADKSSAAQASRRKTLGRASWTAAALKVLETRGIAAVKIDTLARKFEVTRGSFYFHFSGLKDLHDVLLDEWRACNCRPFEDLAQATGSDGLSFFETIVGVWVDEKPFRPRLDLAVRDWARTSPKLAGEVAAADDMRISLLTRAFRQMAYSDDESLVRARITYFHQIGYYALPFKEDNAERKRLQPLYGKVLVGTVAQKRFKRHPCGPLRATK